MDEKDVIQWVKTVSWVRGDKVELICTEKQYIVNITIAYKTNMSYSYKLEEHEQAHKKYHDYKTFFFTKHLTGK